MCPLLRILSRIAPPLEAHGLTQRLDRPAGSTRILACAIAVATIVGCGLSLSVALLAVRLDHAGYSARAIGFNTAAGGVATLVFAPLIPSAARIVGVARLLMAALLLGGIVLVAFTLTNSYVAWLVLRFGIGVAVTVMFVLSEFWITSAAPARRRGLAIGCYVTSLAIGFAIGPLILTMVGTAGDLPFYIGGALFVGAAVPLMLNAGEAPALEEHSRKALTSFLRESPAATLAALLHGAIEVAGLSLLPVYALRSGLTVADGAVFTSLFILGNSVFQLPLGFLSDHVDKRRLLLLLAVAGLAGAGFLALHGTSDRVVFEIALLAWGGIVGAFYPVGLAQLGANYQGADLASANSAYVMTYALGMLAGPPLIGLGLDIIVPAGFFWAAGTLILLYLLVAGARLAGRPSRQPRTS
jgi:MFS family permease